MHYLRQIADRIRAIVRDHKREPSIKERSALAKEFGVPYRKICAVETMLTEKHLGGLRIRPDCDDQDPPGLERLA